MRYSFVALAFAVTIAAPPALRAQHDATDSTSHDHHAMMAEHHSVATVDRLVSYRDSLGLNEDQLEELANLRRHFEHADGHHMEMDGMDHGSMMQQQRERIGFDRVPGKMVPRVRQFSPAAHCSKCPFGILTQSQRKRAHQLLSSRQEHQHQG